MTFCGCFFAPTCEEAAVVLLYFLCRLKLLLGMFLREFVAQVLRVPLLSVETVYQQDLASFHQSSDTQRRSFVHHTNKGSVQSEGMKNRFQIMCDTFYDH